MDALRNVDGSGGYECNICGQSFSSSGHRNRHMGMHSQLGECYTCSACGDSFRRLDSLARHRAQSCTRTTPEQAATHRTRRRRIRVACDGCNRQKQKCDGSLPCLRCLSKVVPCTYAREVDIRMPTAALRARVSRGPNSIGPLELPLQSPLSDTQAPRQSTSEYSGTRRTPNSATREIYQGMTPEICENEATVAVQAPNANINCNEPGISSNAYSNCHPLTETWAEDDCENLWEPGIGWSTDVALFDFSYLEMFPGMSLPLDQRLDESGMEVFRKAIIPVGSDRDTIGNLVEGWLGQPLIPRQYDLEVLNAAVRVFLHAIDHDFSSFRYFTVSEDTTPAQIISMAALGALYSNLVGSKTISRLYFTDGQRMLTHYLWDYETSSLAASTSRLQSYLCIAVFGLCSTHKRAVELAESYHSSAAQCLNAHCSLLKQTQTNDTNPGPLAVVWDWIILQGYRSTLLQLQPVLLSCHYEMIQDVLTTLEYPDDRVKSPSSQADRDVTVRTLGCICALSWYAQHWDAAGQHRRAARSWKPETLERYMQFLAERHALQLCRRPSLRLLLYTNLLAISVPLGLMIEAAYCVANYKTAQEVEKTAFQSWAVFWANTADQELVLRRVDRALESADDALCSPSTEEAKAFHCAHCVYYAILVSVLANLAIGKTGEAGLAITEGQHKMWDRVAYGMRLLSTLKGEVAEALHQKVTVLLNSIKS